jgi:carbamoyltransferase
MLLTAQVRSEHRELLPAVVHVDGSSRIQTVDPGRQPRFHRLISEFDRLTGCPILINTSFNVRGEPIVRTPIEAYRGFMMTDMDALVIGRQILLKESQSRSISANESEAFRKGYRVLD